MNLQDDQSGNPYAAPSVGAETGHRSGFVLSDELRKLIATTSTLMIIAGILQMIPGVAGIVTGGISAQSLVFAGVFGVVPAFVVFAGISLRGVARQDDDLSAVLAGIRQLFVAFLIKGSIMLLIVGLTLLGIALSVLGIGAGFLAMWN